MGSMFYDCTKFNQEIDFDTSKVTDMSGMFYNCKSFNPSDQLLKNFDMRNVVARENMFFGVTKFDKYVINARFYNKKYGKNKQHARRFDNPYFNNY